MKKIIPMLLSFFIFPDINFNFQSPSGLGIDKNGMVYVANSGSSMIKRYSRNGRLNLEFGRYGEDDGCLDGPKDVAINSQGDIYISDAWNNRVCVFLSDGTFKMNIGGLGEGSGRFKFPNSLAIDKDDYLYVVDTGGGIIQKFDPQGRFIMEFGKKEGLKWPSGIAIAECEMKNGIQDSGFRIQDCKKITFPEYEVSRSKSEIRNPKSEIEMQIADCRFKENIYISDSGNNRIMRFSQDGEFIESIRGIENPQGMAFGPDKNLYIADGISDIIKLTNNGFFSFIKNLSNPSDIVFSSSSIFVSESGRNKILKFSLDGILEEEWISFGSSLERLNLPYDIAVSNDNIYIADTGNNRVLRLSTGFEPKRVWDVPSPIAIFADVCENIYCLSSRENVIIKFDKAGNELLRLEDFILPRDLVVDSKGTIFVLTSSEVLRFSQDGNLLGTICAGLKHPSCITLDNFGFILISDGNTIKRFSQSGILVNVIENLLSPSGIAVDKDDNIYVSQREKNEVLKLDFYGKVTDVINSPKLLYPYGLDLDNNGNLYIADCGNHRIVILGEKRGRFLDEVSEKEMKKPKSNLPDLVISEIEVLDPKCGIWTKIAATIKNQGNIKADFISVGFFSTSGRIGFGKIIKSLLGEENTTINTIWFPEESGTQILKVIIDQEDKIKEDNEENNIKEKEVLVW